MRGFPLYSSTARLSDDVVKSYEKCAFVGTDAAEAGRLQGEMIGEYIAENFDKVDLNGDGEISYILFKGEEGNNEAIYRTQYSVEDANRVLEESGKGKLKFYDPSQRQQIPRGSAGQMVGAGGKRIYDYGAHCIQRIKQEHDRGSYMQQ